MGKSAVVMGKTEEHLPDWDLQSFDSCQEMTKLETGRWTLFEASYQSHSEGETGKKGARREPGELILDNPFRRFNTRVPEHKEEDGEGEEGAGGGGYQMAAAGLMLDQRKSFDSGESLGCSLK